MSELEDARANILALRDAMASGAAEIETRTNGTYKRVKYQSYSDMRKALADLLAREAVLVGGRAPVSAGFAGYGRGDWSR
jgi:hypothetical protein